MSTHHPGAVEKVIFSVCHSEALAEESPNIKTRRSSALAQDDGNPPICDFFNSPTLLGFEFAFEIRKSKLYGFRISIISANIGIRLCTKHFTKIRR